MKSTAIFNSLSRKKQYKYPYVLLAVYLTLMLSTVCLASKIIVIGNIVLPGGIFVFPLAFNMCDVVGEVYGYAYPRMFIWIGVIAEVLFMMVTIAVSHLPSPAYVHHAEAYQMVFDPTLRYVLSGLAGLLVGEFVNIYLLAKAKIAMRGKYFIIRCLISTAIGQGTLTIIVDILNYIGKMPNHDLIVMMISGFSWKMVFGLIFAFPVWMLVKYLKKAEQIDFYDVNTNFTPFTFSLDENTKNSHNNELKNESILKSMQN